MPLQVLLPISSADEAETAAPSPAPTGACTYTVKQGDTLFDIAKASRNAAQLGNAYGGREGGHLTGQAAR